MKKTLLLTAAAAVAGSALAGGSAISRAKASDFTEGPKVPARSAIAKAPTRAEGDAKTFDFTYAYYPYTALKLNNLTGGVSRIFMGFEMTREDIKTFAGSKVTGFTMYSPTGPKESPDNTITDGQFFYSIGPDFVKADYTQEFTLTTDAFGENKVELAEPYVITGEEESLLFGYSLVIPKQDNLYYYVVDYIPNNPNTGLVGVSLNGVGFPSEFSSMAESYGASCLSLTLECEHLPHYADFSNVPATMCFPVGVDSKRALLVEATCADPIESIELEYTIGGVKQTQKCEINPAYPAGVSRLIDIEVDFPAQAEKMTELLHLGIPQINGKGNEHADVVTDLSVAAVNADELPDHQVLYEEYTGTWCGWCPRGFAALEYMRKNYPEFVVASFHNEDPMDVFNNNYPVYPSGFPYATLDRKYGYDPYYGSETYDLPVPIVGDIEAINVVPTAWKIGLTHEKESDDVLVATATVSNLAGYKDKDFKLAYLLVADGLSGATRNWMQSNYYSTLSPEYIEELNEFCRGGSHAQNLVRGLVFNDVVVSTTGIYGEDGSIPSTLEPGEEATHSIRFDLSKISSTLIPDRNKLRVVAAVLDERGNVVNCTKDEVNDFDPNAVEGIFDANAPVEYFNLNGMKVAEPTEGIYIRRQGGKAEKVIIR